MENKEAIKKLKTIITKIRKKGLFWECDVKDTFPDAVLLGEGAFSQVFLFPNISTKLVVKLTSWNKSFDWYVKFSQKSKNKHAPKVYYSEYTKRNKKGFYIIERLEKGKRTSVQGKTIKKIVDKSDMIGFGAAIVGNTTLHKFMRNLRDSRDSAKGFKQGEGWFDIHKGNFMVRKAGNGKSIVVLTDPLAD